MEPTSQGITKQKFFIPALLLFLFVGSFLASFFYFRTNSSAKMVGMTSDGTVKSKAGDMVCPLNGVKYDKASQDVWEKRRPLGIMVENEIEARPQYGLSKADVIYEAVAEGGITRFMAVYLCQGADKVEPIRSARTYFLDWISEYDGLYAHVGGAGTSGPADALGQIDRYGIKDLNQFSIGFPTFERDQDRISRGLPIEHTMFTSTQKLWDYALSKFGWGAKDKNGVPWDANFVPWKFIDDAALNQRGSMTTATIPFWDKGPGDYRVEWTYDKTQNIYKRANGGIDSIDELTKQQLTAKDVVVQFMDEEHANDGYPGNQHLVYGTIGSGTAIILENGNVINGTWQKKDRLAKTKYFDASGNEVSFVRGQIWIETVPTYNKSLVTTK